MKYLKFFLLIFITLCSGSLHSESAQGDDILMQQFNTYKLSRTTGDESVFFTPVSWETIKKTRSSKKQSISADILNEFPGEIVQISGHKESFQGDTGCLMVSGTNSNNTPMDYFIIYKLINKRWVIEKFTVEYSLDASERYLTEAVCDAEEQQRLWLEHVEAKQ